MSSATGGRGFPPTLLIATSANRQTIAHCCEQAANAGVTRDMSLAHARALLSMGDGEAHVEEFNPARDAERLRALASWAIRFSPMVAPDSPDGLLLDITGCQRVHRGERRLVNAIANSLEWFGFRARIACASTFTCAWGMARYGSFTGGTGVSSVRVLNQTDLGASTGETPVPPIDRFIIAAGDELESLRPLPIEALRLEPETIDALREVNIDRIGDLLSLPRSDLAARFGQELLLRLDQAAGEAIETIEPLRPIERLRIARAFDGPVKQLEGIALTVQELIAELVDRLRERECGVRRLDVELERIDAASLSDTIMLSLPSRDAKHLWALIRPKIERINLGFGVEKITLTVARTGRLPHAQIERWREEASGVDGTALDRAAGELVDTLASRLGADRIMQAVAVASHVPERAFRFEPAMADEGAATAFSVTNHNGERCATLKCVDRPTALFEKPEVIEVLAVTPEGPPRWLRWRGEEHTVTHSAGPERITAEWWRDRSPPPLRETDGGRMERDSSGDGSNAHRAPDPLPDPLPFTEGEAVSATLAARDYFRIQIDSGRWLWVFRQLQGDRFGDWFVHGEWT